MLDTNIAIHARDSNGAVLDSLAKYAGQVTLSALSLVELQRGLYKNPADTAIRQSRLLLLLQQVPVIAFGAVAAEAYGRIIAQCGWVKGRDYDRMIAAHAISTSSVLVTANEADFRDIPGLKIENWAVV
ncbi:MAG TPA: type II toxin-antitoxin system VapC family toxin [Rhizomicrobium sp.]